MITVSTPITPSPGNGRPMVVLPVDDVAVLLGLLDLLCPAGAEDDDAVNALASRFRTRLSAAIAAAVQSPRELHTA